MTSSSTNEMNIRIPLCNAPEFEWNLEDFSGNLCEKEALTEKIKKKLKILGKQLLFLKYLML